MNRQSIYAALGVPELWRSDGESLRVYRLKPNGDYELCERSPTFPFLPLEQVAEFLEQSAVVDETSLTRSFLAWLREEVLPKRQ